LAELITHKDDWRRISIKGCIVNDDGSGHGWSGIRKFVYDAEGLALLKKGASGIWYR
jgi:hypothetical protein